MLCMCRCLYTHHELERNSVHFIDEDSGLKAWALNSALLGPELFPPTAIQMQKWSSAFATRSKGLLIRILAWSSKDDFQSRLHLTFSLKAAALGLLILFPNLWEFSFLFYLFLAALGLRCKEQTFPFFFLRTMMLSQ